MIFPLRIWVHHDFPLKHTILGPQEGSIEYISREEHQAIVDNLVSKTYKNVSNNIQNECHTKKLDDGSGTNLP